MRLKTIHQTAVVLLDGKSKAFNSFVKDWFKKSRFLTNETTDVFQVIEEISDFTVNSRPEVVLLEVESVELEFSNVQKMMETFSDKCEHQIFVLSDSGKTVSDRKCFEGTLTEIKSELNKFIPRAARAASA